MSRNPSEWTVLVERLEAAEQEFVQGRPAEFQSLWSRADDVTLCGGFGGVERGWQSVISRLDWVSTKYADGSRTSEKIQRGWSRLRVSCSDGGDSRAYSRSGSIFNPGATRHDAISARARRMADRAPARGFANAYEAAKIVTISDGDV